MPEGTSPISSPPGPESGAPKAFDLRIGAVLLGFAALSVMGSWNRDFWNPEETEFAAAAREMAASGDWLTPTLGGLPYLEKPPLLYWAGLLLQQGTGLDPHLAYRIVPALFGALGLWVTFFAGMKFYDRTVGLAAALIQGTSYLYFHCSSWFLTDVLFASTASLSMVAFGVAVLWAPHSRGWRAIGYLALAAACLSKSPLLGPAVVGLPLVVYLFSQRRRLSFIGELRRLRPLMGLGIVAAVVIPWYAWMGWAHGYEFFREHFLEQHFGRLIDSESHEQEWWKLYYLRTLPVDFLPWTLFLPLAVFYGHTHFRRPGAKFFVLWALTLFVMFSLISSKQGKYLLPLWTPLSVLVASSLLDPERESLWESFLGKAALRAVPWILNLLAGALILGSVIWLALPASWFDGMLGWFLSGDRLAAVKELLAPGASRFKAIVLAGVASAGMLGGAAAVRRAVDAAAAFRALAWLAGSIALAYLAVAFIYGDLNAIKSGRGFAGRIDAVVEGRPLAFFKKAPEELLCYLADLPLPVKIFKEPMQFGEEKAIEEYFRSPPAAGGEVFLVIQAADLERLGRNFPVFEKVGPEGQRIFYSVDSGLVGTRKRYILLSSAPRAQNQKPAPGG